MNATTTLVMNVPKMTWTLAVALLLLLDPGGAAAQETVLTGTPTYYWHHGCTPTAIMMILGSWDGRRYPNLIPGSSDWESNRDAIMDAIASPGHIADYALFEGVDDYSWANPHPDLSTLDPGAAHPDDCLADFLGTSRSSLGRTHGSTSAQNMATGIEQYAAFRGCAFSATYYSSPDWDVFQREIKYFRPVLLNAILKSGTNPKTGHSIPGIGCRTTNGHAEYAFRTTWSGDGTTVFWLPFEGASPFNSSNSSWDSWQLSSMVTVRPLGTRDASWSVVSGRWADAANWDGEPVPDASTFTYIPYSSTSIVDTAAACHSVNNLGSLQLDAGELTVGSAYNAGTITLGGSHSMNVAGTLINDGTVLHGSDATVRLYGGAVLDNLAGAVYDLQRDGWWMAPSNAAFNNAGTFRKSAGAGIAYIDGHTAFHNTGTVEVTSGTLEVSYGSSTGAHYEFANGAEARVGTVHHCVWRGTNTVNGDGTLFAGGAVETGTSATFSGFTNGANLEPTNLGPDADATLVLNLRGDSWTRLNTGCSLGGEGTTVNQGNFEWTGGVITGGLGPAPGQFCNNGQEFLIRGMDSKVMGDSVLNNSSTITQEGAAYVWLSRSVVNNLAGGLYDLQGDGHIYGGGSGEIFNNAGTFRKSAGEGTSLVGWQPAGSQFSFHNTGTVEVTSGTLEIYDGSSTGGHYEFANGGRVNTYLTWRGETTARGDGVLDVGGRVAAETTAAFNGSGFTNGARLEVGAGGIDSLNELHVETGATLILNMTASQPATMRRGWLHGEGTTLNLGHFDWTGGRIDIAGGLINQSSHFTIQGSDPKELAKEGVLTNAGVITHTPEISYLRICGTLNNLEGALYDLQGDIWLDGDVGLFYGTVDNAGVFRKSAGTGAAVVRFAAFHNTGTVEVTSGTLSLADGSSTNAHYEFANGGRVEASLTWEGETTANGDGVLHVGGRVAAGTTATFEGHGFTNGARLEVGRAYGNELHVESGASLILNMTSPRPATMSVGYLCADGATLNLGHFEWSGGTIYGPGGVTNEGQFVLLSAGGQSTNLGWAGVPGVLNNAGTIVHEPDASLGLDHGSTLNNLSGGVYDLQSDWWISGGTIQNRGTFRKSAGTDGAWICSSFDNTGTVEVLSGTLWLQGDVPQVSDGTLTGGTWYVGPNSTLSIANGSTITTNQASVTLDGPNSTFAKINTLADNEGSFSVIGGRSFTSAGALANSGTLTVGGESELIVSGSLSSSGTVEVASTAILEVLGTADFADGTLAVDGMLVAQEVIVGSGGVLSGSGMITAPTITIGGVLSPGSGFGFGAMAIDGNPALGADPTLGNSSTVAAVPEPGTWAMLLAAVLGLAAWRRRRRR